MTELQIMLRRFRRAMLCARVLEAAAVGAIGGGLLAVVVMILPLLDWRWLAFLDSVPAWSIPVVLLLAGGFAGGGLAWLGGRSELQAACRLDQRYGLKDQLGTAAELLRAGDHSAEAEFVYAQAVRVGRTLPGRLDFWQPTRRRFGILLLTVLLCVSLLLLPSREERLAAGLLSADARQREAILAALRKEKANASPQASQWLTELAHVIEVRDEAQLGMLLRQLRRAGYDVREILASDLPPTQPIPEAAGRGQAGRLDAGKSQPPVMEDDAADVSAGKDGTTVYHPRYEGTAGEASPEQNPHPAAAVARNQAPASSAWQAARARAMRADSGQTVPARYRRILHVYTRR